MRWPDLPTVHAIEMAAFPESAWSVESFWGELAGVPDTRWYVVALVDGAVAGYAGLMAVGPQADVQTIAVGADHRRGGVGARLLAELVVEARRRGCTSVLLEVRADNAAAVALYQSHGFEQISRRTGYYGPGRDALVMRLRLSAGGGP